MAIYKLKRKTFSMLYTKNLPSTLGKGGKDIVGMATKDKNLNKKLLNTFNRGKSSAGFTDGLKNSWGRAGTMKKAGIVAATATAAGLMAKGAFGGGKSKDKNSY